MVLNDGRAVVSFLAIEVELNKDDYVFSHSS